MAHVPQRPTDLPTNVDDATLQAVLAAGRPEGIAGRIAVDGVTCPTITAGTGRPILFVHGLGHDAWDWTPLMSRLVQRNIGRCVALDMPGFGLADKPAQLPLSLMVGALGAAADACDAPPIVVASSLGGHVALLAALARPDRFASLVLLATGGLVVVPALLQEQLRRYYSVDSICARPEDELVGNSRRIFVDKAHPLCDVLATRKLAVHRSTQQIEFARPFSSVVDDVFRRPVVDQIAALRVPALFINGSGDIVVPGEACRAAAEASRNPFVLLEGVGHCPHLEAPDRALAAIERFIDVKRNAA